MTSILILIKQKLSHIKADIVRSLRLIVWPPEVSEVTEVKMKIQKSTIFDLQKRNTPQKKPHKNHHSDLK